MMRGIMIEHWWQKGVYYLGWVMTVVLAIGLIRGVLQGLKLI